jgi:uncharacterized protein (TIGR02246 family)
MQRVDARNTAVTRLFRVALVGAIVAIGSGSARRVQDAPRPTRTPPGDSSLRSQLQQAAGAVWLAWARNDQAMLLKLTPPDLIVVFPGSHGRQGRAEFLEAAESFAAHNGRLILLELSKTDAEGHGDVAILYAWYTVTYEYDGQRATTAGRATITFVRRNGAWQSVQWHLDSGN